MRAETVKLPSAETAAGARGTSDSCVLVTQRRSSSGPVGLCMPLLAGGEASVSLATSARCLSGVWTEGGSCSFKAGSALHGALCEEQPGAPLHSPSSARPGGDSASCSVSGFACVVYRVPNESI